MVAAAKRFTPHGASIAALLVMACMASAQERASQPGPAPGAPPPRPPVRGVPGITAPEMYARACVSCHTFDPETKEDTRIGKRLEAWKEGVEPRILALAQAATPAGVKLTGKHPSIGKALESIPKACLDCHAKPSERAPAFAPLMHAIHLLGGADNGFMTVFQGECTHCHKLDPKTRSFSVPSGPEIE